jgi:hypothetical protein
MPDVPSRAGGTHRSHAFRVQGDRAMLASAVVVSAVEIGDGELRLSLAPGRIGHAFPTGDIFRRVEVRATPITATGEARPGGAAEVLGRSFEAQRGQSGA